MNKILSALAVVAATASSLMADNPIIKHIFTADPSAHLYEGKVFIYPSHDQDKPDWFNMVDYHVFSSTNLVDWTDHGVALDVKDVPWAKEYMWAPDCAYKDGTYFFYFPARDKAGEFRIGVATSPSPAGPFKPEPKHNGGLKGGGPNNRSVCLDRLYFNPDGTIQMVEPTKEGVPAVDLGEPNAQ